MTHSNPYDVFVVGLDDRNLDEMRGIEAMRHCRVHQLLAMDELKLSAEQSLEHLLERAQNRLREHNVSADAIVGYWDFPVTSMVPILCRRLGLPGADLEAVLKCEHKYWSRLEQQKVIDEYPRFSLVDLDDTKPPEHLAYPLWVKPVKSFSSELAFRVADDQEFAGALEQIRDGIERVGEPFRQVLQHVELPHEIASVGGQACLVEESVSGTQVTIEGYNTGSTTHIYGVIDSHDYPGTSSFQRYQYPSGLPARAIERISDISRAVIEQIGLRRTPFNIEYFWDSESGTIHLLEINPRHSQSHAPLFDYVDGAPNHLCMVQLGLGQEPELPYRQGPYRLAAKWYYRLFEDGVVRRAPTEQEIAATERQIPGCTVDVLVRQGDRLSLLPAQDSYSYAIASVATGANDEEELRSKYDRCVDRLHFEFGQETC